MKNLILTIVLMCGAALAQVSEKPVATNFGELGLADEAVVEAKALEFVTELSKDPKFTGVIFVYGTETEILRREQQILKGFQAFNPFHWPPVTFVRAGFRPIELIEFWIVPRGADLPLVRTSELADKFGVVNSSEFSSRIVRVLQTVDSKANVVAYVLIDATENEFTAQRNQIIALAESRKITRDRIVFVRTGKSRKIETEIWLLQSP